MALNEAALERTQPRAAPGRKVPAEELAAVRDGGAARHALEPPLRRARVGGSDRVALLGIEPDPKAGTVVISGDSKDYLAALSYVLNLSRAQALDRVHVRHELKKDDPQAPVRFAVSAAWAGAKP